MNEEKKIILPEKLQIEMMKFFLRTSIPRIKKEKESNRHKKNLHLKIISRRFYIYRNGDLWARVHRICNKEETSVL